MSVPITIESIYIAILRLNFQATSEYKDNYYRVVVTRQKSQQDTEDYTINSITYTLVPAGEPTKWPKID
jgi:hypothetical protein